MKKLTVFLIALFRTFTPLVALGAILLAFGSYELQAPFTQSAVGSNIYDFEGSESDKATVSDHDDLSFCTSCSGSSGTDTAFSACVWIEAESSAEQGVLIGKYDGTSGSRDREWVLVYQTNETPQVSLYDEDDDGYIGRTTTAAAPTGKDSFVCLGYDGSEAHSGIDVYINCVELDDSDAGSGTYNGMVNGATDVRFSEQVNSSSSTFYDGLLGRAGLWSADMTTSICEDAMSNSYSGLASGTKTNLVAWWDFDGDMNDDHASSCGGNCNATNSGATDTADAPHLEHLVDGQVINQDNSIYSSVVSIGAITITDSNNSFISSDKVNMTENAIITSTSPSSADGTFSFDVTIPANDSSADCIELRVRFADESNTDFVKICDETAGNDLEYISEDTGTPTTLAAADIDWSASTEYTVEVIVNGNNLHTVRVDGVSEIEDTTTEASNVSASGMGAKNLNEDAWLLDDLEYQP